MARVIRTRSVQPDGSVGVFVAAVALVGLISIDWLTWYTLILVILLVPITNALLTNKTTHEETRIEKDV